ncbi:hypothetical protein [Streptomyces sp. TRM68416]|uniref:hypothetical protein n=1 Tax=Streptomyces sp. TRM68416 TaxID=2758412 RepID=UPI001661E9E1|nr:hypothetical protein [Streptomyces sp. TRM68416]MBD0841486.1 hypothetical protein [Streptomyces sp. TRM68416]
MIAPICVEALIAYIKGEAYSFVRALVVLGVISLAALVLFLVRASGKNLRTSLDAVLFITGLATFGIGVSYVADSAGASAVVLAKAWGTTFLGLLITITAGYSHIATRSGSALLLATRRVRRATHVEQYDVGAILIAHRYDEYQDADQEVEEKCREALHPQDLQFIGYYVDGRCRFHIDALEAPALNPFFRRSSRDERRQAYERTGRQLDWLVEQLDTYMQHLSGGILIRVVFDVEQGALYYCNLDERTYLMGVTMIQDQVLVADEKIRRLANELGHLPRSGPPGLTAIRQVAGGTAP